MKTASVGKSVMCHIGWDAEQALAYSNAIPGYTLIGPFPGVFSRVFSRD
jgi:hypothetical protein